MRSMRDNTTSWGDLVNINNDDNIWNQPFATNLGEYNSEWYNTSRLTVDQHTALIAWMRAHNWEIEEISFDSVKAFPFEPASKVANAAPVPVVPVPVVPVPVPVVSERELLAIARAIAHEQAVARNAEIEARKIALAAAGQPINRKEKRAAAAAAAAALAASSK